VSDEMRVAADRVVTIEYTVNLQDGRLLDSTGRCGPIAVMIGAGQLFEPIETRIMGLAAGDTREIRIPADDAYGPWREELVRTMPRDRLPPDLELVVGEDYRLKGPDEKTLRFRLLEIGETEVRVDFNAPHAGQDLLATVTIVAVRSPSADEARRGRV